MDILNTSSSRELKPAVFLDRDGVINLDFGHVGHVDSIVYVDGALTGVKLLNDLGFRVFIVTNQAGIGKGLYTVADFESCMEKIAKDLADLGAFYDDIRFCPFHPDAVLLEYRHPNHFWRKPNPGMLHDLMRCWNTNEGKSFLVGDKESDINAAKNASINGYLFDGSISLYDFLLKVPEIKAMLT